MTLQQATLPTPRFDQIELENLKQDIQQAIQAGQEFLNTLTAAPIDTAQQLSVLEQVDTLENNLSESWGVLIAFSILIFPSLKVLSLFIGLKT